MATFSAFTTEFVSNCCRTCGKAVPSTSRKALFSTTGKSARIAERLSAIGQIEIQEGDGLPHFCCKRCVSRLDRLTAITTEAENIKQELSTNLLSTTTRLNAAMRWKSCSTQVQPPRTPQQQTPPKTPQQKELPRTPQQQTIRTNRMRSPTTPGSAVRQPMKKARIGSTPTTHDQLQSDSVQEQERQSSHTRCHTAGRRQLEFPPESLPENLQKEGQNVTNKPQRSNGTTLQVKVEIGYTKPKVLILDGQPGNIVKCLARKEYHKLASLLLSHPEIGKVVVDAVVRQMQLQCEVLVSTKFNSILRRKGKDDALQFNWESLLQEWEKQAPIFFSFLKSAACTPAVRSAQPMPAKAIPLVCMAGAILLKVRNQNMSALQRIISMLLNAGHVSKQTYVRLQRVGVCLSHTQTIRIIDQAASNYAKEIMEWKAAVEQGTENRFSLAPSTTSSEGRTSQEVSHCTWKIVGDNLDLTVRVRDMRMDNRDKSIHFFHHMAAQERVSSHHLESEEPTAPITSLQLEDILPNYADYKQLRTNFIVLLARIITSRLEQFKCLSDVVPLHIDHEHSEAMKQKCNVLPLGVILKNENVGGEMIEIMEYCHQYVPSKTVDDDSHFIQQLLIGGDQLTCERARNSQRHRRDAAFAVERLEALEPVVEDWHTKMCLFQVIFNKYFDQQSAKDGGTLCQLRNIINRSNVTGNVKKEMNATEDFLKSVLNAHVVAAALNFFGMDKTSDEPTQHRWDSSTMETKERKWKYLCKVIGEFTDKYIMPTLQFDIESSSCEKVKEEDGIYNYTTALMTDCLVVEEFSDAIREGDGGRVIQMWKFLLLYFRAAHRTKYALEALTLLVQVQALFPPRLAHQVKWNRFVNTQGKPGCNIPCDLEMEHQNREFKAHLATAGGNITSNTIVRTGKSLKTLSSVCDHFDNSTNVAPPTVHHSTKNATKDEEILVHTLHSKCKVFQRKGFHSTPKFQKVSRYNFSRINKPKLKEWFKKHIRKMKVREDYRKKLQQPLPTCQLQSTQQTHPIPANWSTEIFSFDLDSSDSDM